MRIPALATISFLLNVSLAAEPVPLHSIAWPALSTNGQTIAFEWLNDIWIAPLSGGDATRLVKHVAREAYPKFSPDSKRVVFSSERTGSAQVYSIGVDGEDLVQHTNHSEGNILETISPDGSYAITRGIRSTPGYKASRLMKIDLARPARELLLFDATAHSVSVSADGKRFLFCRGGEQLYRTGYRGSRASEIHLFDAETGQFSPLIDELWEAKTPLWRADGQGFYYVSNRSGCFNVWLKQLNRNVDQQLTFFEDDSVVIPVLSGDGRVMLFRAGQKVFRFFPDSGKAPEEIKLFTKEKLPNASIRKEKVTGTSDVAVFKNDERIVFSAAGDLWVKGLDDDKPLRLMSSDETDERELELSRDESTIYFLSDDGVRVDICSASFNGENLSEQKVLFTSDRSKRKLQLSPDGNKLSWLEATGDLVVGEIGKDQASVVMPCWDTPTYDWSPDGRWLVVAAKDIHSNRDIWLVPADGSQQAVNVTRHPAFEGSPKWSPDGSVIAFSARRESDETARLWTINVSDLSSPETFLGGSRLEMIRASLKQMEGELEAAKRVVWNADSKSILFQTRDNSDEFIYQLRLSDGLIEPFADFRGLSFGLGTNGKSYWRSNRTPAVYDGEKLVSFPLSFSVRQQRADRLRLGFRKIWRTLGERFYDESMNGKDWDAILKTYEESAANARESRQFDRVVAQLLGELNASHLTFKSTRWGLKSKGFKVKKPTAHPGVQFKASWEGPLVIEEVIPGTPISQVPSAPLAGETVLRIAGKDVDSSTPLGQWFNGSEGRVIPIVIANQEGEKRVVDLIPVSYSAVRSLKKKQMLERAHKAANVEGFGYLAFPRMKKSDLEKFMVELYRTSLGSEGIILDLRNNSGGRVADELLALFCQPVHTFTLPRSGSFGYPTDRRVSPAWNGPMVVLCNENTYSNAEIFCHAFKQADRGKLVGEPTNGGVISAVGVKIPEVGELQVPFRGWFHAQTGRDLELNGAVPDEVVPQLPQNEVAGDDPQFDTAMRILIKAVENLPKRPKARYKHEAND